MSLSDFPPEVLTKIFRLLSYESLLAVQAVCVQWHAIVGDDPELGVHMFKRMSKVYVEPGSPEPFSQSHKEATLADGTEPVRLHPAVQAASYVFGDPVSSVRFGVGRENPPKLVDLSIANDFISIPVVTMLTVNPMISTLKTKVKNAKGIRVIDLFNALEAEYAKRPTTSIYGTMTRSELICSATINGEHYLPTYCGLEKVTRAGLALCAEMYFKTPDGVDMSKSRLEFPYFSVPHGAFS
ncbi:hypothetical protein B0H14DRAFT_2685749 [Mycena olivaceomarginata]|nr:hypothetical protein B0H14DRAFT_2685749 [Mycena olivaceomarginata]